MDIINDEEILINILKGNDWKYIFQNYYLSIDLIEKYYKRIELPEVAKIAAKFQPNVAIIFKNKFTLGFISQYQNLTEDFIEKHSDEIDWDSIGKYQTLSEEFIEKYQNKLNWLFIGKKQVLSEQFIEKFADKLDWTFISKYQKLSDEFIIKHASELYKKCLLLNENLSDELKEKIKNYKTRS
jgi:hypothetical protein